MTFLPMLDVLYIWVAIPAVLAIGYLLVIVYRLTLHPLAKFPGPKLAAASQAYEAYYDLWYKGGGEFSPKIRNLHKKYGPIVRISPIELSINDAEFCAMLYAPLPKVRDKHPPSSLIVGTSSGTFSTADHYLHRKRRAASSPLFSLQNLAAAEPLIQGHIERMCEVMEAKGKEVQEMKVMCAALCFDIFFDFAFNDKLDLLLDLDRAAHYQAILLSIVDCAPFVKVFPWTMKLMPKVPLGFLQRLSTSVSLIRQLQIHIWHQASKYMNMDEKLTYEDRKAGIVVDRPVTLFESLQREKLPPEEKTLNRMAHEGSELFAASWTPSSLIALGLFHLLNRPDTLSTLRKELDEHIADPRRVPGYKELDALPYMHAVIKEVLRINFPVTTRMPLICREPMGFKNWVIPKGTPISVNMRAFLADEEVFPEPYRFKPERFLGEGVGPKEELYNLPFGRGARMCQGKDLALYEMYITIATLVRRYELELFDTTWERDVNCLREPFLALPSRESKGIRVKIIGHRE